MKLKLDKDILLEKLNKAIKFIDSNTVIPALQNFKFTVVGEAMEIIAQNNHVQLKISCPVMKSEGDVSFCLPAKLFFHTVNLFRENEVLIKIGDNKIELKNGKSKYNIIPDTLPENFPFMEMKESTNEIMIHQFYLKMALRSTERFVDDTSVKFNAEGINIAEVENRIVFTGISGQNTMCRISIKPLSIAKWDSNVVFPAEFASKVVGMLEDKGDITICSNENRIVLFVTGDDKFEIMCVIKKGQYPNSEALFKHCPVENVTINSAEFKDAVKRLKLYTSDLDSVKKIKILSNPENPNELILQAIDTFKNKDGEERLTISGMEGTLPVNKTFNANWLLEILGVFEESEFNLFHSDNTKIPCCIYPKSEGTEESNFKFIISQFND